MSDLHGSVGLGGNNRESDVLLVQTALRRHGVSPGPLDKICGRKTMAAIEHFQSKFLTKPDGRVDPHGPSWRRLEKTTVAPHVRSATPHMQGKAGSATPRFPVVPVRDREPQAPSIAHAESYWRQDTPLPAPGTVNRGLVSPSSAEQVARFQGMPSAHMSQQDKPVTNPVLLALMATESVGPFRATGLKIALASLRSIFAEVKRELPDLYPLIGKAGMQVNRLQRGSTTKVSNHAWGSAIDLTIAGKLVPFGAPNSCRGLDALVPYFNRAGWYWGGGYRRARADAMHFECGATLMRTTR